MRVERRSRTRVVSLLCVLLAIVLAPLLVAESAQADISGGETYLKTAQGVKYTWGGLVDYGCGDRSFCGADGPPLAIGFKGAGPRPDGVAFCYLDSRDTARKCLTASTALPSGFTAYPGADAYDWLIQPVAHHGWYAGTVCVGDSASPLVDGVAACGLNLPTSDPRYSYPRTGWDMGHKAEAGDTTPTLPGQQDDGSVDPVACTLATQSEATSNGNFDPVSFILAPVKCAFLWATVMPDKTIPDLVTTQSANWSATQLGQTVNDMDFYTAFNDSGQCGGITLDLSGFHVAGGPAVPDMHLLKACPGDQLKSLADLVRLGLTIATVVGGAWNIARMISRFINGPEPSNPNGWEDQRLF